MYNIFLYFICVVNHLFQIQKFFYFITVFGIVLLKGNQTNTEEDLFLNKIKIHIPTISSEHWFSIQ